MKLINLIVIFVFCFATCLGQTINLCDSDIGYLELIYDDNVSSSFANLPVSRENGIATAFLPHASTYTFKCVQNHSKTTLKQNDLTLVQDAKLKYNGSDVVLGTMGLGQTSAQRIVEYNDFKNKGGSYKEDTLTCNNVCSVNLIVFPEKLSGSEDPCGVANSFQCNISNFEKVSARNGNLDFFGPRILGEDIVNKKVGGPTCRHELIKAYSIFDPTGNNTWMDCEKLGVNKTKVTIKNHAEDHTKSIDCPLFLSNFEPRPLIIRIEEKCKKMCGFIYDPDCQAGNSYDIIDTEYFSAQVDAQDIEIMRISKGIVGDNNSELDSNSDLIVIGGIIGVVIGIIAFVAIFTYCLKSVYKRHKAEKELAFHPTFYAENPNRKISESVISEHTERTDLTKKEDYINMFNIDTLIINDDSLEYGFDEFSNMNDDSEEGIQARKQIIKRQLSGDPTKINPDIPLNQQAKVLSYNPQYEIDFSHFKTGKVLGSGNFGSVFEGTAQGIFYPGSETKVAIKTVNDPLDRTQFVSLMCEIKILGNLELNLNLVNLLGSCTSNSHNGELFMLLEFCPHGNLKDFLIRHRQDFYSSVINNIAVNNLDERLFFKWAHDIAKGMEYLYKKKIMHGDLAARNILIGGMEGDPNDNYVAKISDFGLSKNFYDNYRYKKTNREEVPWKWMAFEYLNDGQFSMKSDVWSYGVVIWEILSLGQEPYAGKNFESIKKEFIAGFRLSCPQELRQLSWLEEFYSKVTTKCWVTEPKYRYNFTDLVRILEKYLTPSELKQNQDLNEQYKTMRAHIMNDETRLKRISTIPAIPQNYTQYTKVGSVSGGSDNFREIDTQNIGASRPDGYVALAIGAKNPENSMTVDGNGSYITIAVPNSESPGISDQTVTNNDFTTTNLDPALNGSYITVTQAMS